MKISGKSVLLLAIGSILGGVFGSIVSLVGFIAFASPIVCEGNGNQTRSDISTLRTQLERYKSRNGDYPTTEEGLRALAESDSP